MALGIINDIQHSTLAFHRTAPQQTKPPCLHNFAKGTPSPLPNPLHLPPISLSRRPSLSPLALLPSPLPPLSLSSSPAPLCCPLPAVPCPFPPPPPIPLAPAPLCCLPPLPSATQPFPPCLLSQLLHRPLRHWRLPTLVLPLFCFSILLRGTRRTCTSLRLWTALGILNAGGQRNTPAWR